MSPLSFSKWEGLGNDFIVLDARDDRPEEPGELAETICDRHFGAGADGLILLTRGQDADLGMEIYNSDGSPASMCGNAIRCLAAMAHRHGLVTAKSGEIVFSTPSGLRSTRLLGASPWWVEVDMGRPSAWGEGAGELSPVNEIELELGDQRVPAFLVSMGNPHCVVLAPNLGESWLSWGKHLEKTMNGDEGTNVEFVEVYDTDNLGVKVWERGAGATLACGTGACAALVAMASIGKCHRAAQVSLPGGALQVEWTREGRVLMRGPARELYRGEWSPDPN
ncbi:MAG: diaminopimelate epimerase [Vulcanimicrobiota bacterium]